ncbi:MAG: hypothetical protein IPN57_14130 [Ignavibacteria bacterium]|nr:hypothetical protein [Ignavibacteria bacterium]
MSKKNYREFRRMNKGSDLIIGIYKLNYSFNSVSLLMILENKYEIRITFFTTKHTEHKKKAFRGGSVPNLLLGTEDLERNSIPIGLGTEKHFWKDVEIYPSFPIS